MAQITTRPHWISKDGEIQLDINAGKTVKDSLPQEIYLQMRELGAICQVNGETVDDWAAYIILDGDDVRLYSYPSGGGDKGLLSAIAVIALTVAAGPLGGTLSSSAFAASVGGISAATGTALITVGGSLVLGLVNNALIKPPPQPSVASSNPFYALTGGRNQASPWGSVPRVYGKLKVTPNLLQSPTDDLIGSTQYLYQIFDFGYGPLKISDAKIGNDPVGRYTGSGGRYKVHQSFKKGDSLSINSNKVTNIGVGATLRYEDKRDLNIPNDVSAIDLDFSIPKGLFYTNLNNNNQYDGLIQYKVELKVGGSWQPATKFSSVSFSNDKIMHKRLVLPDMWMGDTQGLNDGPIVKVGPRHDMSRLIDQIVSTNVYVVPIRSKPQRGYGRLVGNNRNPGLPPATSLSFYPDSWPFQPTLSGGPKSYIYGTDQNPTDFWIETSNTSSFSARVSLVLDNVNQATQVRVTRLNRDAVNKYSQSEMTWTKVSYESAVDTVIQPEVEHTVAELKVKATDQINGTIETYNAIAESILPVWNGYSWSNKATRNPAWIFCDILRGSANKNPIVENAKIDLPTMLSWAQECDQYVSGEPRYACDMVIGGETTVKEALQAVAAIGRASPTIKDGKISVIRESQQSLPVQLITPKNSRNFTASMSYASKIHGLKVTFLDAGDGYESAELRVYNDGYSEGTATVLENLDLPGVTNRAQAYRAGRYFIAQGQLRRERATVTMDIENLICQRGDLVYLSNDVLKVGGEPLRVLAVAGNTITVDETLSPGVNGIRIRGESQVRTITQLNESTFTVSSGHNLQVGSVIDYGVTDSIKADYLIEEITPSSDLTATVTMVEYRPEIINADTGPVPPRIPKPGIDPDTGIMNGVQLLSIIQSEYIEDRRRYADLMLTWRRPYQAYVDHYLVYDLNGETELFLGETKSTQWPLDPILVSRLTEDLYLQYGVVAVSKRDEQSTMATTAATIPADKVRPNDVLNLGSNILTDTIHLFWDGNYDRDLSHYELRYSTEITTAAKWSESTIVADEVPYTSTSITVPARTGTYFIKAVDTAANYSENAAQTLTQVNELEQIDLREVIDFDGYAGTFENTELAGGQLTLVDGFNEGWWYADRKLELGTEPWLMRLIAQVDLTSYSISELLNGPHFTPLDVAIPLSPSAQEGENDVDAQIYIKRNFGIADDTLDSDWFSPLEAAVPLSSAAGAGYDKWERLISADIRSSMIEFAIKLTTKDLSIKPIINNASVLADWHERVEKGTDVSVASGGTDIAFNSPFALISETIKRPSVTVSLQNATPGDTVIIFPHSTLAANAGFRVQVFNAAGTTTAGSIDWQALGVGRGF